MSSHPARAAGTSGRFVRAAFVLCCLLVLGFQQFAAQTHIHAVTAVPGQHVLSDKAVDGKSAPGHNHDTDDGCALCQLAAAVGNGIVTAPPAPVFALLSVDAAFRVLRSYASILLSGHAWQSRAPPVTV